MTMRGPPPFILPLPESVYYDIEYEINNLRALSLQQELEDLVKKYQKAHGIKKHGGRARPGRKASKSKKFNTKNWDV